MNMANCYPTTIPEAYAANEKLKDAYERGWAHGHGLACHNVPKIGDRIEPEVDYVGLGRFVDEDNAAEYHSLLCHASADNSRCYSPFEFTAKEFNDAGTGDDEDHEGVTSEELWEAFEAGTADAISADLEGYGPEDYGVEVRDEELDEEEEA